MRKMRPFAVKRFVAATMVACCATAGIIYAFGLRTPSSGAPSPEECNSFLMDHIDQDPTVLPLSADDVAFARKCLTVCKSNNDDVATGLFSRWVTTSEASQEYQK
jgi:hypothetical protein